MVRRLSAGLGTVILCAGLVATSQAARVDGLYAATVPVVDGSPESLQAAYAEALRQVLVKVTGRRDAGVQMAGGFGDPQRLVQQYRRDSSGALWAQFDAAAIRGGLDAAGQPVWGENRPSTLAWIAYDAGDGERDILGSEAASRTPAAGTVDSLRSDLLEAAAGRGVPLLLPMRDSQDLAAVAFADVWGDFSERVRAASRRYRPDAVLVGRARLVPAGMPDVRWTLQLGEERFEWRGSVVEGPHGLADRLSQRLATAGAADETVLVAVSGVTSFDGYGQVSAYLRAVDLVESLEVPYVSGDVVVFRLRVRGGAAQLANTFEIGRLLYPDAATAVTLPPAGRAPDLTYRLSGGQ
jgi:hypothetical protein